MTTYRVYPLKNDHIANPPHIIECASDDEAIERAKQYVNGENVELWEGPRFVRSLKTTDAK